MKVKIENVDIIAFLGEIVNRNTVAYREDFDIDKDTIRDAAKSDVPEDRRLLWMSRSLGTWCFAEHKVLIRDSMYYNAWRYYIDDPKAGVKAYAVHITGEVDGIVRGDIYPLDYASYCNHLAEVAAAKDDEDLQYLMREEIKLRNHRAKSVTAEEYLKKLSKKRG